MAPKLVLTYFDIPGAAEPIRWALEQSGQEWEDKRLTGEEFGVVKPSLPNGQLPVLEVDGYTLPQSMTILRYVGKLGGLHPSDDLEAAKCDAVLDAAVDFYINVRPAYTEKDQAKQLEMFGDLAVNYIPKWLANVEKQLAATEGIYFAEKMSVADIMITTRLKTLRDGNYNGVPTTIFDSSYPNLNALYDSIVGEPKIAAFIAKHDK
uniref:Glutathione S-transferase 3 n=1 Tax=Laminaria digitata TaxID=80365 RepID=B1N8E8_9PHAE|nr:glutathione S-transferase 3 [Laminaria digitata]